MWQHFERMWESRQEHCYETSCDVIALGQGTIGDFHFREQFPKIDMNLVQYPQRTSERKAHYFCYAFWEYQTDKAILFCYNL